MKTKSVHQKEYQCYPMEQNDSPNSTIEKGKNYALSYTRQKFRDETP